ncbi:MAG: helix-turn-helix domain-containing protein [Armatimonadota bacterium]|nr:helix-turn-helix domain-containing protein [Armatimonadota bacterium]
MRRWSLTEWYRYLESQFESAESPEGMPSREEQASASEQAVSQVGELSSSESSTRTSDASASAGGEKGRALVSIRVPRFEEFVPFLRSEETQSECPINSVSSEAHISTPSEPTSEPPSEGPRLRKRKRRPALDVRALVPPEADEVWAKLPKYLRYLAEWTDDSVPRKYYPVRGRDESREELIARLTDPVLTLEETARLLGVCPATIRRYTNRGWLRCFRTEGNQRRFRLSDIVAFLEEQAMRQPRGNRTANKQQDVP